MNKKDFKALYTSVVPDTELVNNTKAKMRESIMHSNKKRKTNRHIFYTRVMPVGACLIVVMIGTMMYSQWGKTPLPPVDQTPPKIQASLPQDIKGLPIKDYQLSIKAKEAHNELQGITTDKMGFERLIDFFEYEVDSFVIVKATNVQTKKSKDRDVKKEVISTVEVLHTVYGTSLPESITIKQFIIDNWEFENHQSIRLRKNGVYLLPLKKYDDKWYNGEYGPVGDNFVLFEIDDNGNIYSHSKFKDFKKYDDHPYSKLTDEIRKMAENETLMLAASKFGKSIREKDFDLVELVITSDNYEERSKGYPVYDEHEKRHYEYYTYIVSKAHITQNMSDKKIPDDITIYRQGDEPILIDKLYKKGRYLLFIEKYDGKFWANESRAAKVNPNGIIESFVKGSVFFAHEEQKVEDIKALVKKVNEYMKTPEGKKYFFNPFKQNRKAR